jgi:hypothetical protein
VFLGASLCLYVFMFQALCVSVYANAFVCLVFMSLRGHPQKNEGASVCLCTLSGESSYLRGSVPVWASICRDYKLSESLSVPFVCMSSSPSVCL